MYKTSREYRKELTARIITILLMFFFLAVVGTFVYHWLEGWSFKDSFFFATASLTTRGYFGLRPSNWISIIFTVMYFLLGVGIIVYAVSTLIGYYTAFFRKKFEQKVGSIVDRIQQNQSKKPMSWVEIKPKR